MQYISIKKAKKMKRKVFLNSLLFFAVFSFNGGLTAQNTKNYISFKNVKEIHEFFAYKADGSIIVSGHRGGREKGFPENSIEGFQNVLHRMPAIFETDPRMTKDSSKRSLSGAGAKRSLTWTKKMCGNRTGRICRHRIRQCPQARPCRRG
jgi:hypothetical protein